VVAQLNGFPTRFDSLEEKWEIIGHFTQEILAIADNLGVTELKFFVDKETIH